MKIMTNSMTEKELLDAIEDCQAELEFRKKEIKAKLIKDFENAFLALEDAHIKVRYTDYEQEAYRIFIGDVDNFEFD